jgi:phosphatidylinositol-3-phosphatase
VKSLIAVLLLLGSATACSQSSSKSTVTASTSTSTTSTSAAPITTTTPSAVASSQPNTRVMLIVLENREYGDVVGKAPYLTELARRYGSATQSFGTRHPSLPNYLELISGKTSGVSSDCTTCHVNNPTLVDQLHAAGIEWQALIESLPSPCFTGASAPNGYAKKHNPFVYFDHVVADRSLCDHVIPLGPSIAGQLSPSPRSFTWVSPNLCHDGHDCSTTEFDAWLRQQLDPVLASAWFTGGGTVIITFDEGTTNAGCCKGQAHGGHIVTLVLTPTIRPGLTLNTPVDHAGILGTVEDMFGLPRLADATCTCAGSLLPLVRSGA